MTQVREEYLRWICVYLWCCGTPACDQEPEYRLLNYCSLERLRESLLTKLKGVEEQRFHALRDTAGRWYLWQDSEKFHQSVARFDRNLPPISPWRRMKAA